MAAVSVSLMGRVAVHLKMISMDQLAEVTRAQARGDSRNLGELLVEAGYITREQLATLVAAQKQVIAKQKAQQAAAAAGEPRVAAAGGNGSARPVAPPAPARGGNGAAQPVAPAASTPAPNGGDPSQARPASAPKPPAAEPAAPPNPEPVPAPTPPVAIVSAISLPEPSAGECETLHRVLHESFERGASDIHVHGGDAIRIRLAGKLTEGPALPQGQTLDGVALAALTPEQRGVLASTGELDFSYVLDGVARFRANAYRQHRGIDAVFRAIPFEPPTLDDLGLPHTLARFTNFHQGMVLVTGPTGCGKSSTLAALVNLVNEERNEHIITIEDPIEYVHSSKRSLVNQRSVKSHTESFARALRAALREDPDVIVIGELRDLETISLAITAAETGHLVIASLHTDNAIRTVNRLVGAYPADQQNQIRTMIADSLKVVISQRLIPTAAGDGRVPAVEIMVVTKAVGNLIRENKTFQIHSILQTGASQGMVLLDDSIKNHVQAGTVTVEEALNHCQDPKRLGG